MPESYSSGSAVVMEAFGNSTIRDNNKPSFWKKNVKSVPGSIKPVYGAQHPPLQATPDSSNGGSPTHDVKMSHSRDSFEAFAAQTSDAWDDAEDDLLRRLSVRHAHSAAVHVMSRHRRGAEQLARAEALNSVTATGTPKQSTSVQEPAADTSSCQCRHSAGPGVGVRLSGQSAGHYGGDLRTGDTMPDREKAKCDKFCALLQSPSIDMDALKAMSWSGLPQQYRPTAWKILSGYLPPNLDRRDQTLERKRKEYFNFVQQYFHTRLQDVHQDTFRQIHIDVPRMSPLISLFQQAKVQEIFERILYIWAIRHPASGYVQGINDLVTPFFVVFLTEYVSKDADLDTYDVRSLNADSVWALEADCFWCFSKLLDGIQDNYTFAQPGIQLKVNALKDLTSRIDSSLHEHLMTQHIEYLQFTFRWMNNLLMREMPLRCVIRLWDTYLAEPDGFAMFHLYVCAAFLTKFSPDLQHEKDFQGLMLMLQNLPTHHWTNTEINLLLAEAYKLKFMFADAPKHLDKK